MKDEDDKAVPGTIEGCLKDTPGISVGKKKKLCIKIEKHGSTVTLISC